MKVAHSKIVGGSTAYRVINCPASVELAQLAPPRPSSAYADEGTLCHLAMAEILSKDVAPESLIGMKYANVEMTEDLLEDKIFPALDIFDNLYPDPIDYVVETEVHFGDTLPDVFGSADVIGRASNRAIVLDWKFGSGVKVKAEENYQGLFYAAAAMMTKEAKWAFEGVDEIEIIIVQPTYVSRWVTNRARVENFVRELTIALKNAQSKNPTMATGSHCRWCPAKPTCPAVTGAVDRARVKSLKDLDADMISEYLAKADMLEDWIRDLRALAQQMLENNVPVPAYKLVAKRATRQWLDPITAPDKLRELGVIPFKEELLSPAQAEKELKKLKKELPQEMVVSISSGNTLVEESDPRPAALLVGGALSKALKNLT